MASSSSSPVAESSDQSSSSLAAFKKARAEALKGTAVPSNTPSSIVISPEALRASFPLKQSDLALGGIYCKLEALQEQLEKDMARDCPSIRPLSRVMTKMSKNTMRPYVVVGIEDFHTGKRLTWEFFGTVQLIGEKQVAFYNMDDAATKTKRFAEGCNYVDPAIKKAVAIVQEACKLD